MDLKLGRFSIFKESNNEFTGYLNVFQDIEPLNMKIIIEKETRESK